MHDFDALVFPAAPERGPGRYANRRPELHRSIGRRWAAPSWRSPVGIAPSGLPMRVMGTGAPGTHWSIAAVAEHLAGVIELPRSADEVALPAGQRQS